mgnify:FL=1
MSFTPAEIAAEIQRAGYPLQITYKPDFRQKIADSWPESLDDSKARQDWGWKEEFDLPKLTAGTHMMAESLAPTHVSAALTLAGSMQTCSLNCRRLSSLEAREIEQERSISRVTV